MDKAFMTPADEVVRELGGDRRQGLTEEAVRASRERSKSDGSSGSSRPSRSR